MPKKRSQIDIMNAAIAATKEKIKIPQGDLGRSFKIEMMRDGAHLLGKAVAEEVYTGKDGMHPEQSYHSTDVTVCNAVDELFSVEFLDGVSISMNEKKRFYESFESGFDSKKWDIEWERKRKHGIDPWA